VVFLGNGRCGKSSLLRCLAKLPLDPEEISTRGVKVDVQMNADEGGLKPNFFDKVAYGNDLDPTFWDFAGQLEYSASHHTFLSSRQAVYVIVFSVIENYESVQQQLSYWLSLIPNIFTRYVRVIIAG
jgi:GTPase SAR1 family protein